MRTARPVGLTDDGRFLIVEPADGESILVPADESRTTLRNRPRRHLETELEQSMTPREIQMKIRAGASVEEIAEASGMPITRVEAFAAPVIAERNHIAGLAQLGSVRRTGESTGHRTLRDALGDRLKERGVDPDTVEWDAFKMDDGRWSISAAYRIEQADRVAVFYFDQRGRFSVSGNDEGRWATGEQPAQAASVDAGHRTHVEDVDTEPTLKLASPADELALLRAIEIDEPTPQPQTPAEPEAAPDIHVVEVGEPETVSDVSQPSKVAPEDPREAEDDEAVAGPQRVRDAGAAVPDEPSQLDLLYDLLGSSDGYAEDSIRVFEGLSDATAVPDVADSVWQEADEERDYPAEPDDLESQSDPDVQPEIFADGAAQDALPGAVPETRPATTPDSESKSQPLAQPEAGVEPQAGADAEPEEKPAEPEATEPQAESTSTPKSKKRKRASVPSWDEIMFGSPTPKRK